MTPRFSLYLDFIRFFAAFLVVLSHWAYPRFTNGDYIFLREWNLGSDAVVIFFVLSGLVIAYTAHTKDTTLEKFTFSRLTRLYSVAIPAVLLTLLLDHLGQTTNPADYAPPWYSDEPAWRQLFYGLTFSNEWSMDSNIRLGSNGPYWSLSYEAFYYLLFALAMFWRSPLQPLTIVLLVFFVGPAVLLLLPIWLMGVALYHLYLVKDKKPKLPPIILVITPILLYVGMQLLHIPAHLLDFTTDIFGEYVTNDVFRFSNEFIWNNILGVLVAVHLAGIAALCRADKMEPGNCCAHFIHWCAGASFSLYLLHYPALQYLDAALPDMAAPLRHVALLMGVLALCFLFAECSERRLKSIRATVKSCFWPQKP